MLAKLFGLYDRDQRSLRHLTIDELPQIAAWSAAGTATLAMLLYITPVPSFTIAHAVLIWSFVMTLDAFLRGGARWLWRRITPRELTCVLGTGELARAAKRKIELFHDMHLELVELDERLPHGGSNGDAKALVRLVDRIIVAAEQIDVRLDRGARGRLPRSRRQAERRLAAARPCGPLRGSRGSPTCRCSSTTPGTSSRSTLLIKRGFDIAVVGRGSLLCRAAVPADRGRDQARQPRAGALHPDARRARRRARSGCYKFRTMVRRTPRQLLRRRSSASTSSREPVFKLTAIRA